MVCSSSVAKVTYGVLAQSPWSTAPAVVLNRGVVLASLSWSKIPLTHPGSYLCMTTKKLLCIETQETRTSATQENHTQKLRATSSTSNEPPETEKTHTHLRSYGKGRIAKRRSNEPQDTRRAMERKPQTYTRAGAVFQDIPLDTRHHHNVAQRRWIRRGHDAPSTVGRQACVQQMWRSARFVMNLFVGVTGVLSTCDVGGMLTRKIKRLPRR